MGLSRVKFNVTLTDFSEWDISDNQYYKLEELVDGIIDRMKDYDDLEVIYEC